MDADDQEIAAALAEVLRLDPSFAGQPERLSRALLDLLPYQPRTVRLLTLGAALGVPTAPPGTALDRLVNDGGLQPAVAGWVLAHFRAAISAQPFESVTEPVTEPPGQPTVVRLGVGPDGQANIAVVSATGIYATSVTRTAGPDAPTGWRRIATPAASRSRDVALVFEPGSATILWSDSDGVYARDLTHGEPRLLVPCSQPRYPLAALAADRGSLDILWATDREALRHSLIRTGIPPAEPTESSFGRPGERLTCLDLAQDGDRRAWLVILTDQGRLLVAAWDLTVDAMSTWTEVEAPTPVTAVSIVQLGGRPTVVAGTSAGHLLSIDAGRACLGEVSWRSVDRPAGLPPAGRTHTLSAASSADGGWLAVGEQDGT